MNNSLKTTAAVLSGLAAGALIGILTAPRSGKKTRKMIKDEVDSTKNALEAAANEKLEEARSLLNSAVRNQVANGKEALNQVKEKMTS